MPCRIRQKLLDESYALVSRYTDAIMSLGVITDDLLAFAEAQRAARKVRKDYEKLLELLACHRLAHGC
jgi:hypothetical protein